MNELKNPWNIWRIPSVNSPSITNRMPITSTAYPASVLKNIGIIPMISFVFEALTACELTEA